MRTKLQAAELEKEKEVRALRDKVYGQNSSDLNWKSVRDNWMRPDSTEWLRARVGKPLKLV